MNPDKSSVIKSDMEGATKGLSIWVGNNEDGSVIIRAFNEHVSMDYRVSPDDVRHWNKGKADYVAFKIAQNLGTDLFWNHQT